MPVGDDDSLGRVTVASKLSDATSNHAQDSTGRYECIANTIV
jgi:hypothetical protein